MSQDPYSMFLEPWLKRIRQYEIFWDSFTLTALVIRNGGNWYNAGATIVLEDSHFPLAPVLTHDQQLVDGAAAIVRQTLPLGSLGPLIVTVHACFFSADDRKGIDSQIGS